MPYRDLVIEAANAVLVKTPDKQRLGQATIRVLESPAGEMRPEQAIAVSYDDRALQLQIQKLIDRGLDRAGMVALGRTLAAILLPHATNPAQPGVFELFAASLSRPDLGEGLRLRLRLPPLLAALPWEYLYLDRPGGGDGIDGFVALDPRVSIVRHEAMAAPAATPAVTGTLRVLVALASPDDLPPLDLAQEQADLEQSLVGPQINATYLQDATLDEVQRAIPGCHIFHFAGHGLFQQQMGDLPGTATGVGQLALYDQRVPSDQLGVNLRGNGVRLALLGACETGRRDGINVWSGVAPALVKADLPAVVANQFPISDVCAIAFSKHFYQALVGGLSIERAVAAGRVAAFNAAPAGRDWGVPVLYLRSGDGQIFAGAADDAERAQARAATEKVFTVRTGDVGDNATVSGVTIGTLSHSDVRTEVTTGDVSGSAHVSGANVGTVAGEAGLHTNVQTGAVSGSGSVTGATIADL